jgi:serine/threonine protein phosphatase 1
MVRSSATVTARTVVIGDIHGDLPALERLLARLPALGAEDTLVFLGDYVDRGPDPRGVVERVRAIQAAGPQRTITLRGNHEDKWADCFARPDANFLLPVGNGCANTYRSFTGGDPIDLEEGLPSDEFVRFLDVPAWLPREVAEWFASLPLHYEDEHAVYVHACLEPDDRDGWKSASESQPASLLWGREPSFFRAYEGKRVIFGHTLTRELPTGHLGKLGRLFDDPADVWFRGPLIGLDTGAGKDGCLSAIELPSLTVYTSR